MLQFILMKQLPTVFGCSSIEEESLPSIEELKYSKAFSTPPQPLDNQTLISFFRIRGLVREILTAQLRNDILHPANCLKLETPDSLITAQKEDLLKFAGVGEIKPVSATDIQELKSRDDYKAHVTHTIYQRLSHIQQQAREEIDENIIDMFACMENFIHKSYTDFAQAKASLDDVLLIAARTSVICTHQGMKSKEAQQFMADVIKEMFKGVLNLHVHKHSDECKGNDKRAFIEGLFKFLVIEPKEYTPRH